MSGYTQLTQEQRYQIQALMKAGHIQLEIADIVGVPKSTISREISRNQGLRGYRPKQAHQFTINRWHYKSQPRIEKETWQLIKTLLSEDWSPEQISFWLKIEGGIRVSHEWIYQYVLQEKLSGGNPYRHLRCQLINRISIDDRPAVVETRRRIGDWELDTIIGKDHQQAIVSLTERKSRLTLIHKVEQKTADKGSKAIIHLLKLSTPPSFYSA